MRGWRWAIGWLLATGVTLAGALLLLGPPGQGRAPLAAPPSAAAGTVWSWGRQPVAFESNPVPLRLEGLGAARAITAGAHHGLALQPDGSLWAWGRNDRGQLGSGSTGETSGPVQVRDAGEVVALAAGEEHSLALRADGSVWAWGSNAAGQLGDGSTTDRSVPTRVGGLADAVAIAAGGDHSLALVQDGGVWAWGDNDVGQLGNGGTSFRATPSPQRVGELGPAVAIAAGSKHSLAVTRDGAVWAWGRNDVGQLGNGSTASSNRPLRVPGLEGVGAVAAGSYHSLALKADGSVWTWGWTSWGLMGDGSVCRPVSCRTSQAVAVSGLSEVVAVAAGCCHSLALTRDGTVYAWGNDESGQVGGSIQTGDSATRPVRLAGLDGALAIATAGTYSLAITATRVRLLNGTVEPAELTLQVGDSVLWTNAGGVQHRLVGAGDAWDSGPIGVGRSYARLFDQPGTFDYACSIHPTLRGSVRVAKRAYARVEDDGGSIAYSGRWRPRAESQASGGAATYWDDAEPGQASLSWTGRDVRIVMPTGPQMGMASVVVDGDAAGGLIDLYSPVAGSQQVVFELQDLAAGAHQVVVTPSAQKNAQSGGFVVALDAIDTR